MIEFKQDAQLISNAEISLAKLRRTIDQLNVLYSDIENFLNSYQHDTSPEIEVRLRACTDLFDSYFLNQLKISEKSTESISVENDTKLNLSVDGNWLTHEMGSLLFSVNTIFQLFSIRDSAIFRIKTENGLPRTRKDVYDHAKLFYYLTPEEELKVKKIHFASPGEIELVTQLTNLIPALKDVIYLIFVTSFATRLLRDLPAIYRYWINSYLNVRQAIRENERRELAHQFFVEAINGKLVDNKKIQKISTNLKDIEIEQVSKALALLDESIVTVTEPKIADPIRLTSRIFDSLSSIARLFDIGKLSKGSNSKDGK
ncbi:hypothetical protein MTBBW1_1710002 [Desulfamplus magnetovallimortis]|uniref:Uncharacterized protein n=1 Tax=Desulfamplus magnetovallimortis TaxID=1246637 RepID=A0A1W1H9W9_9BACT|nr:hypothetical protein [Desulfamplus magnetovallimortis]SLM29178.1 hypothetical protein MTBBW1_1710002 [Desulfamplus magnetovallimortis]